MNKQQNKQKLQTTHIYINISCKCDTNRAGHFTLDAYASRPVAWLFHWGRVTYICVADLATIGSDNDLSPVRRQAIIWTNAGILLIGLLGTNFSETLIRIQTFSLKKIHLKMLLWKMAAILFRPQCVKGTRVATPLLAPDEINTLGPKLNDRNFSKGKFKCICVKENGCTCS